MFRLLGVRSSNQQWEREAPLQPFHRQQCDPTGYDQIL